MIASAPQLLPGLEMYYEAFVELSTCRSMGLSPGSIPWTAIDRYAERNGFEGDGYEYMLRMVRALDDAFLAHTRKKEGEERARAEADRDARTGRVREAD